MKTPSIPTEHDISKTWNPYAGSCDIIKKSAVLISGALSAITLVGGVFLIAEKRGYLAAGINRFANGAALRSAYARLNRLAKEVDVKWAYASVAVALIIIAVDALAMRVLWSKRAVVSQESEEKENRSSLMELGQTLAGTEESIVIQEEEEGILGLSNDSQDVIKTDVIESETDQEEDASPVILFREDQEIAASSELESKQDLENEKPLFEQFNDDLHLPKPFTIGSMAEVKPKEDSPFVLTPKPVLCLTPIRYKATEASEVLESESASSDALPEDLLEQALEETKADYRCVKPKEYWPLEIKYDGRTDFAIFVNESDEIEYVCWNDPDKRTDALTKGRYSLAQGYLNVKAREEKTCVLNHEFAEQLISKESFESLEAKCSTKEQIYWLEDIPTIDGDEFQNLYVLIIGGVNQPLFFTNTDARTAMIEKLIDKGYFDGKELQQRIMQLSGEIDRLRLLNDFHYYYFSKKITIEGRSIHVLIYWKNDKEWTRHFFQSSESLKRFLKQQPTLKPARGREIVFKDSFRKQYVYQFARKILDFGDLDFEKAWSEMLKTDQYFCYDAAAGQSVIYALIEKTEARSGSAVRYFTSKAARDEHIQNHLVQCADLSAVFEEAKMNLMHVAVERKGDYWVLEKSLGDREERLPLVFYRSGLSLQFIEKSELPNFLTAQGLKRDIRIFLQNSEEIPEPIAESLMESALFDFEAFKEQARASLIPGEGVLSYAIKVDHPIYTSLHVLFLLKPGGHAAVHYFKTAKAGKDFLDLQKYLDGGKRLEDECLAVQLAWDALSIANALGSGETVYAALSHPKDPHKVHFITYNGYEIREKFISSAESKILGEKLNDYCISLTAEVLNPVKLSQKEVKHLNEELSAILLQSHQKIFHLKMIVTGLCGDFYAGVTYGELDSQGSIQEQTEFFRSSDPKFPQFVEELKQKGYTS